MNDPNGLVFWEGEYHLFYQAHPASTLWGPMHWGHAVSPDLVNWRHLPLALSPDALGTIFSGSAIIDQANTAGFGADALVAAFTHDRDGAQTQSLAYSLDRGRAWTKYPANPVLAGPNDLKDFRDPKIFWFPAGDGGGHWVMLLAAGDRVLIYTSPDLKRWAPASAFGPGYGETAGVWETPELLHLPVDGGPQTRWVLAVGVQKGAPAGGSGTQYFIGQFDGRAFASDYPPETVLWADYGADFYAAQAWNDAPGGRHLWAAWLNNWDYARQVPTAAWRGALTLPRELSLASTLQGPRLVQQPIVELQRLRGQHWTWRNVSLPAAAGLLQAIRGDTLEIIAEFQVDAATCANCFGLRLRVGAPGGVGQHTTIGYLPGSSRLFVDRTQSGAVDFGPGFAAAHTAPLAPMGQTIRLHIFVDRSSVEVFGNDGLISLTDQIFPAAASLGLEAFSDGGSVIVTALEVFHLTPAQFQSDPGSSRFGV